MRWEDVIDGYPTRPKSTRLYSQWLNLGAAILETGIRQEWFVQSNHFQHPTWRHLLCLRPEMVLPPSHITSHHTCSPRINLITSHIISLDAVRRVQFCLLCRSWVCGRAMIGQGNNVRQSLNVKTDTKIPHTENICIMPNCCQLAQLNSDWQKQQYWIIQNYRIVNINNSEL